MVFGILLPLHVGQCHLLTSSAAMLVRALIAKMVFKGKDHFLRVKV
jgi:hypothetical protein